VKRANKRFIVGVDEVGYGAWAGPLVVAAAAYPLNMAWPEHLGEENILDSKRLKTHKRRMSVLPVLEQLCTFSKIVEIPAWLLDRLGAANALCGAIHMAAYACLEELGEAVVLVDGNPARNADRSFTYITKGDTKSHAIAAASVMAKVHRDLLMKELDGEYPGYGFGKHVGYGTPMHKEALERLGVCKLHRRSYRPIKEMLDGNQGGENSGADSGDNGMEG